MLDCKGFTWRGRVNGFSNVFLGVAQGGLPPEGEEGLMKLVRLLEEWKILLFIILIIVSILAIHPFKGVPGVLVEGVRAPASQGLRTGYVITKVNGSPVSDLAEYNELIKQYRTGDLVKLSYKTEKFPYIYVEEDAYPFIAGERDNETYLGLSVGPVKTSNLHFGLEIEGGTKVLLIPNKTLDSAEIENILEVLRQRLNLFGLKEVPVSFVTDLSGTQYIRIEFAGATEDDVKTLLEKEGDFEGRVGNITVFTGDDILSVCISGVQCHVGLQPVYVGEGEGGQIAWRFSFQVDINAVGAERFANVTRGLEVGECGSEGCYLNDTLSLYLDKQLIEDGDLRIPTSIQGQVLTQATIIGMRLSKVEAQNEMRKLQAILQSRRLPVKLDIVSVETLSPALGREFAANIFIVFIIALIIVDLIIGLRYRNYKIVLPIIIVILVEIISTLGIAALINWTLDLASIAGIMAAVGIGLNDQIIITDEVLRRERGEVIKSFKRRLKNAFFVIFASFAAIFASMIPLLAAGGGLLRGFALTTMIGSVIGVTITRPAYASMLELLIKKD